MKSTEDIMEDLGIIIETAKEKQEAGIGLQRVKQGKATPTVKTTPIPRDYGAQDKGQRAQKNHPGLKKPLPCV